MSIPPPRPQSALYNDSIPASASRMLRWRSEHMYWTLRLPTGDRQTQARRPWGIEPLLILIVLTVHSYSAQRPGDFFLQDSVQVRPAEPAPDARPRGLCLRPVLLELQLKLEVG